MLALACQLQAAEHPIPPEFPTSATFSNRDINRIACPGTINDLIFSEEKGIVGHFSHNNAFIKFKIEQQGTETLYATQPSELFVVCDQTVYTLIATPKNIPSATIWLAPPPDKRIRENIEIYAGLPLERQVLRLIREAYSDTLQSGYRLSQLTSKPLFIGRFEVKPIRRVLVDGIGLCLKEYIATSMTDTPAVLKEESLIKAFIGKNLMSVAIDTPEILPGESSRVFLVERQEQTSEP
jgi:conjugal transfer pilus assembly protein TraK